MSADLRYSRFAQQREFLAESVAAATRRAIDAGDATGREPLVMVYTPAARGNPYQQLLYRCSDEFGVGVVPTLDLETFDGLRWPYPVALHLHWTRPITSEAESASDAEAAVDRAIEILSAAKERGVRLLWSVHNVLPHECRFPEVDARLRRWLSDNVDVVHVLGASTVDQVAEHYTLPVDDRLVHVPIPSYTGVYPDHVTRAEARFELGLRGADRVGVLFGALRGYKGIDLLAEASDRLDAGNTFVVAGSPVDEETRLALEEMADRHPNLLVAARRIPVEEVQMYMRAANYAVLPYVDALNSGAGLLAVAFGLPVVGPELGTFTETISPEIGELFPPGDVDGLVDAVRRVLRRDPEETAVAVARFAEQHSPEVISRRFFTSVRSVLG
jgi:glycosyltransferase involved in cell wall biosynthesis